MAELVDAHDLKSCAFQAYRFNPGRGYHIFDFCWDQVIKQGKLAQPDRIPGLDLLRAIAILLVFCWHYQNTGKVSWLLWITPYGWVGVDLFFVLSGFLIAGQLFKPLALGQKPSFKVFYLKRALRILPAYLAVVALYFLVPSWNERHNLPPLWRFLTFTQNFSLDRSRTGGFSHAWSLCVEEHFYLVFPLLVFLVFLVKHKIEPKVFTWVLALIVFLMGMILRAMLWLKFISPTLADPADKNIENLYDKIIYYPSYNRLDGFLTGVVIALLFTFKPDFRKKLETITNIPAVIGLIFICLACWLTHDRTSFPAAVFGFPVFSLGFGGLVMSAATNRSILNRFNAPWVTFIANLAYSFYLTHKELIHLFYPIFRNFSLFQNDTAMISAMFVVSIFGAQLLHTLVEQPFLNLRNRFQVDDKPDGPCYTNVLHNDKKTPIEHL